MKKVKNPKTVRFKKSNEARLEELKEEFGLDNINQTINWAVEKAAAVIDLIEDLKEVIPYKKFEKYEDRLSLLKKRRKS